jgi:large subunit ribosomal protein L21
MAKTATTTKKATSPKAAKAPAKKAAPKKMSEEFAVIMTGGKQYVVAVGDVLDIELIEAGLKEGDTITFDQVLLVDNGKDATIGTPYIKGAKVTATYQGLKKGEKVSIFRYKAKSNRDRRIGHRQHYARVRIGSIS